MDEIVKKALAKWPNVPHCYGWLALDGRGHWRMRDERAQALGLAGDKVSMPALLAFINRNYMADASGAWYFQNGPQRVYVNLASTPYIVRTGDPDPLHQRTTLVLHTGAVVTIVSKAWMTESGRLILCCDDQISMLDDRDMTQILPLLSLAGEALNEFSLAAWLAGAPETVQLVWNQRAIPIKRLADHELAEHFGFISVPQAPPE